MINGGEFIDKCLVRMGAIKVFVSYGGALILVNRTIKKALAMRASIIFGLED